jgi:hypothetical protein
MISFSRPFGSLCVCCGAVGAAIIGRWAMETGDVEEHAAARLQPAYVSALPPLPSRDSLAALLVSGSRGPYTSRATMGLLTEALRVIDWIPSSHERADLLSEIAAMPELDPAVVAEVADASRRISSMSARASILRTLIRNQPAATSRARYSVLQSLSQMHSTPERALTLELFVSARPLEMEPLIEALSHAESLRADNERARVLIAAAGAQQFSGRGRAAYVRVANGIRSERYRSRAFAALEGRRRRSDGH